MKMMKRIISMLLCGAMLIGYIPAPVFAEDLSQVGLCEHHPEHTGCSYAPPMDAADCTHLCGDACYAVENHCVHVHEGCGTEEVPCEHACEEGVCFIKTLDCTHEHDGECGYAEAVTGVACDFVCALCAEGENTEPSEEATEPSEEVTEPSEDATEPSAEETEPEPMTDEVAVCNRISVETDLPENDEIFALYVEGKLYGYELATFGTHARAGLNSVEKGIYDVLKARILSVAANGGSTVFPVSGVTGLKTEWTNKEITFSNTDVSQVEASFETQFDLDAVMSALVDDCPFDLYWFDKTEDGGVELSYLIGLSGTGGVWTSATIEDLTFTFMVANDYQGSSTSVTTDVTRVNTAKVNAAQVVSDNEGKTDYEKLVAYKQYICSATSYNQDAANNKDTPYGDPWQLINVFDKDPKTTVVCEGYAKAFQYLCDLGGLDCISAVGVMAGGTGAGNHMWNVVTLGGKNYLVDVTNCDEGTVGAPDQLFLVGAPYVDGRYSFDCGNQTVYFICSDLDLEEENYTEVQQPPEQVTVYTVTVNACQNGTVTANPTSAEAGTAVTLIATPDEGYVLKSLDVRQGSISVAVENGQFIMPAGNVTVTAEFEKAAEENDHIHDFSQGRCECGAVGGSCGEKAIWAYDSATGTLTISGAGEMDDYFEDLSMIPWRKFYDGITKIVIGDGVTTIGTYAFYECTELQEISISDSVTTINISIYTKNLDKLVIPAGVTELHLAFEENDVKFIEVVPENKAYSSDEYGVLFNKNKTVLECYPGGSSVSAYTVPEGVTEIKDWAFRGCRNIEKVTLSESLEKLCNLAFCYSGLQEIHFQGEAPEFGYDVFAYLTADVYYPKNDESWTETVRQNYGGTINWVAVGGELDIKEQLRQLVETKDEMTLEEIRAAVQSLDFDELLTAMRNDEEVINYLMLLGGSSGITITKDVPIWNKTFHTAVGLSLNNIQSDDPVRLDKPVAAVDIPDGYESDNAIHFSINLDSLGDDRTLAVPVCIDLISPDEIHPNFQHVFWRNPETNAVEEIPVVARWNKVGWSVQFVISSEGDYVMAAPENAVMSGKCGDNLTWRYDDTYTLTISGSGEMYDYDLDTNKTPWYSVRENVKHIEIGENVTGIGAYAFYDCRFADKTVVPPSVKCVGEYAFYGMDEQVFYFEGDAPEIADTAFYYAEYSTIYYHANKQGWPEIISKAFVEADGLEWVPMKEGSDSCGESLTWEFDSATGKLTISGTGEMINTWWPYEMKNDLPEFAPWHNHAEEIKSVVINSGVTSIGHFAFFDCVNLTSVSIPEGVTFVGCAFVGCDSLKELYIPASVTDFRYPSNEGICNGLEKIVVSEENTVYSSDEAGMLYNKEKTKLIGCPTGFKGSCTIPDGVKIIGDWSFYECSELTSVALPDSVVTIGTAAFNGCEKLAGVVIPEGVTTIPMWAFNGCAELSEITIPTSVTKLGSGAFAECDSLAEVYFKGDAPDIEYDSFYQTATVAYYPANNDTWTEDVREDYCGKIEWVAICGEGHGILPKPVVKAATNAQTGGGILTWEDSGADCYEVYRATSSKGKYSKVATVEIAEAKVSVPVGKTYYFKVKAIHEANATLNSAFSAVVKVTGKCAQPSVTVTASTSSGKPVVKWGKITSAVKYDIYRATSSGGTYSKVKTTTTTSYTDTAARVGTTYYYKVRAIASTSTYSGAYSAVKSCVTRCACPVVTLTTSATSGKPIVSWKTITGAVSYEIWRAESSTGTFTRVASNVTKLSYTDSSAKPDKDYWYKVKAIASKEMVNSAYSAVKKVHSKLAKPSVTFKVDTASGKPSLSWKAVDGAVSYKVYRSAYATKSYKAVKTVKGTSYTDTSVAVSKGYYYKIIAIGANSNSAYSSYKKLVAKCAQAKAAVTVSNTSGKPVVKWSKISGAAKYDIYRATSASGTYSKVKTTTSTSYTDTTAKVGVTYYYRVRAVASKSSYNGVFSVVRSCTAKCARPTVTLKTVATTGKPVLSWNAVSGAVSYELWRSENGSAYEQLFTEYSGTSYVDNAAEKDSKYSYKVKAIAKNTELSSSTAVTSAIAATCGRPAASIKLSSNKPRVSWKSVDGAVKYYVYRSTKSSSGFKKVATVTALSYTDKKAAKGTTYYYKVVAVTAGSNISSYSNTVKLRSK